MKKLLAIAVLLGATELVAPAQSITIGVTTQSALDDGDNYYPIAVQGTTGSNSFGYAVASLSTYVGTPAAGTWGLAIYTDASTSPAALVCAVYSTATPSAGWNSLTPTGCGVLTSNTPYWIVELSGPGDLGIGYDGSASAPSAYTGPIGSTTFPNPFGSLDSGGLAWSIYATLNPIVPTYTGSTSDWGLGTDLPTTATGNGAPLNYCKPRAHCVILTWTPSQPGTYPIDGYNIYRSLAGCGSPSRFAVIASSVPGLTYVDSAVTGAQYSYYLTAVAAGVESPPSICSSIAEFDLYPWSRAIQVQ